MSVYTVSRASTPAADAATEAAVLDALIREDAVPAYGIDVVDGAR